MILGYGYWYMLVSTSKLFVSLYSNGVSYCDLQFIIDVLNDDNNIDLYSDDTTKISAIYWNLSSFILRCVIGDNNDKVTNVKLT